MIEFNMVILRKLQEITMENYSSMMVGFRLWDGTSRIQSQLDNGTYDNFRDRDPQSIMRLIDNTCSIAVTSSPTLKTLIISWTMAESSLMMIVNENCCINVLVVNGW